MPPLKVKIDTPESIRAEIGWAWDLFCTHWGIDHILSETDPDLRIGMEEAMDVKVSERFEEILRNERFDPKEVFHEEPLLRCRDGTPDVLGTAFYMVNSLQEWQAGTEDKDEHGRFRYSASYQARFDVVERDLVSELFDALLERLQAHGGSLGEDRPPTRLFLTHDIDRITRGNLREASDQLKRTRILGATRSLFRWMLGDHEWANIEGIMELHERFGFKSSFFWLTEKGVAPDGIRNADYDVQSPSYRDLLEKVARNGFSNGLHKSSFSSSLQAEFQKLRAAKAINRHHYLKIRLPDHYQELEDAGFLMDTSLGFRERIGYRNSYGRPFHPFDPRTRKAMKLMELPLNIMDLTLLRTQTDPLSKALNFIDGAAEGSVITVLWHNNLLTDGRYQKEKKTYEELLRAAFERGLNSLHPDELFKRSI
jgi:hypothetical protein